MIVLDWLFGHSRRERCQREDHCHHDHTLDEYGRGGLCHYRHDDDDRLDFLTYKTLCDDNDDDIDSDLFDDGLDRGMFDGDMDSDIFDDDF